MFLSKRRLLLGAASIIVLLLLAGLAALDVLRVGEAAVLYVLWLTAGMHALGYRNLRSLRSQVDRRAKRLERAVNKRLSEGIGTLESSSRADLEAIRQLLEGVHHQTLARVARLEAAVDDIRVSLLDSVEKDGRVTRQLLESTVGLQAAMRSQPLPPMRGWAGFADLQSYLYRLVRATRPSLVVECGSGVSTIVIAAALADVGGGSLVSLDHEEWYASRTRSWLVARGLEPYAKVLTAPLGFYGSFPDHPWYQHEWLTQNREAVDLLVVDGPPGSTAVQARLPAVPLLHERLTADCIVVLDDADRPDERAIVEAWKEHLPTHQDLALPHVKGTRILFPENRPSIAGWID